MVDGFWDLKAQADHLGEAAFSWNKVSKVVGDIADGFADAAKGALAEWEGDAAESFQRSRTALVADLDAAAAAAGQAAGALQNALGAVHSTQGALETSWASVMMLPYQYGPYGSLVFQTSTDEERQTVRAAEESAREARSSLDEQLASYRGELASAAETWRSLVARWLDQSTGEVPVFDHIPGEGTRVGLILVDGRAVLSAGSGNNEIVVTIDPKTGEQIVTVDGIAYRIPGDTPLTIRGGGGNDSITLPSDTDIGFTVVGGAGLDRINGGGGDDRIFGLGGDDEVKAGGGNDYVSGGAGHDYIDGQDGDDRIFGGTGRDTLYGLGGRDRLSGGADADYLEGGEGEDLLFGGADNDVLSGGRGNDEIFGGAGDDISYGGLGTDKTVGGLGSDTSYDDAGSAMSDNEKSVIIEIPENTSYIRIEGSPEFRDRVQADLDLLSASPTGQKLLANLQDNHDRSGFMGLFKNSLTIREYVPENPDQPNSFARRGMFGGSSIDYQPTIHNFREAPPVVVLQHELGHVYDYWNGTFEGGPYQGDDVLDHGFKIAERQASGLPIDHDKDPSTPEIIDPNHPLWATENGLRDEMGLPMREHYR